MQFVPLEDGFEFLGCPTPGRLLDSFLTKKYDSLKILCERLVGLEDPHSAFALLRVCAYVGKVNHCLRALPPLLSRVLEC